eukprot:2928680-Lingulodinium_polyedra.AAC.1
MVRSSRRFAAAAARASHVCVLRARRFSVRAWSRACGLRAVATVKRRSDCVVAQGFRSVAQWCGRAD